MLALSLSGCVDTVASVTVPAPEVGATYTYRGPEGNVTVTVKPPGRRYDGAFRVHGTTRLNVTIDPAPEATCRGPAEVEACYFEVAVDGERGLVVQHVGKCGNIGGKPGNRDHPFCRDERAVVIFGGGGFPGAFGAGPFWGNTVEPGSIEKGVAPIQFDRHTIAYSVEPTETTRGTCFKFEADTRVNASRLQTLYLATVTGPFVLCDGLSLPLRFTTVEGETYRLVDSEEGNGSARPATGSAWNETPNTFPRRRARMPLVTAEAGDPFNFSVPEAHRAALNQSETYRTFADRHPDAIVVKGWYHQSGEGQTTVREAGSVHRSRWYRQELTLVAESGGGVHVVMEKRIESTGPTAMQSTVPQPNQTRLVSDERVKLPAPPTRSTLASRRTMWIDVAGPLESIQGFPPHHAGQHVGVNLVPEYETPPPFRDNPDPVWRQDGLTYRILWPDPSSEGGGGVSLVKPYHVWVDSARGTLLGIELNRSRLPLTGPPPIPGI